MDSLNYRRGLNRVFVILCCAWAIYLLYIVPSLALNSLHQNYLSALSQQEQMDSQLPLAQLQKDVADLNANYAQLDLNAGYAANAENLVILAELVFVPAIFYFLMYGLIRLYGWVALGFKRHP